MKIFLVCILCLTLCGCGYLGYESVSANDLHRIVEGSNKDNADPIWFYLGTDNSYHYFVREYYGTFLIELIFQRNSFKVNKSEIQVPDPYWPTSLDGLDELKETLRPVFMRRETRKLDNGQVVESHVYDFSVLEETFPDDSSEGPTSSPSSTQCK
jgi:hypothetical protein